MVGVEREVVFGRILEVVLGQSEAVVLNELLHTHDDCRRCYWRRVGDPARGSSRE